jgi:hypothetical protein
LDPRRRWELQDSAIEFPGSLLWSQLEATPVYSPATPQGGKKCADRAGMSAVSDWHNLFVGAQPRRTPAPGPLSEARWKDLAGVCSQRGVFVRRSDDASRARITPSSGLLQGSLGHF